MRKLGPMDAGTGFEFRHANKYVAQGLKTAFLPDMHCVHLAPTIKAKQYPLIINETYARHGIDLGSELPASAYDLRGTPR